MAEDNSFASNMFAKANQANEQEIDEIEEHLYEQSVAEEDAVSESASAPDESVDDSESQAPKNSDDRPILFGPDSDLLTWDEESQAFVPVDDEALAALQKKGNNLQVFQASHGTAQPERFYFDGGELKKASVKPAQESADPNARVIGSGTSVELGDFLANTMIGLGRGTTKVAGASLAGAKEHGGRLVNACSETINKWKADRQQLTDSIKNNASEQVQQRQEAANAKGLDDLNDAGEVAHSTRGLNADALQSATESMREDTKKFKVDFDQRKEQFKSTVNTNLETIFQAMGYGDPQKAKAGSLDEFSEQLKGLPERKQEKVNSAIEAIKSESSNFKSYVEEKADSPEAAKADIEDQEGFAKSLSDLKDDPSKEVDKKYRDMMDKIGMGGESLKDSLGNLFKSFANLVGRVAERAGLMKANAAHAVSMNQGNAPQQGDRLG